MLPRREGDWIESFLRFTKDIPSPEIFRKWVAISTVAGSIQRRVWIESANGIIYPNLFVLLVAPPAVGKTEAIRRAQQLWLSVNGLHVAPNSVTRASLLDVLDAAQTKTVLPNNDFQIFNALNVAASEFGVLVPAHDTEFLNTLNDIYDNPDVFREQRRHRQNKELAIQYPMLNIVAGTQPGYLATMLPEEAWSMGFTSRLVMIYSATQVKLQLFTSNKPSEALLKNLTHDLTTITKLWGPVGWHADAAKAMVAWYEAGLPPAPTHSRLQHYNGRRLMFAFKLCAISSVSRGNDLTITPDDFQRATGWMLEAEELMPDIFRDMAGKSDKQVMDDLHDYLWRMYARDENPIHESRVYHFLSSKVPSEKISRIIDLCERTGCVRRTDGDKYLPGIRDHLPGIE